MIGPRRLIIGISFLLVLSLKLNAQYSLSETGWVVGGGVNMLSGGESTMGPAAQAGGFFSHYTCGKRYGFHFTGGAGLMLNRTADQATASTDILDQDASLTMGYLYLGAYGKLRPHTYHRPREICFLVGPQLEVPFLARYKTDNLSGNMKDAGAEVSTLLPALHISAQIRRPLGDELSFFIEPGVDAQLSSLYTTSGGARSCLRFTLALGMSVWNDH